MLKELRIKFSFVPTGKLLKIIIIIFVAIILIMLSIGLFMDNKALQVKNQEMDKFIKSEKIIKEQLVTLKEEQKNYYRYILKIKKNSDLEKLKANHLNLLLNSLKKSNLKIDSYKSGNQEPKNFMVFKYNIKFSGNYSQILDFLIRLGQKKKFIYINDLAMEKHNLKLKEITAVVNIDILGEVGK